MLHGFNAFHGRGLHSRWSEWLTRSTSAQKPHQTCVEFSAPLPLGTFHESGSLPGLAEGIGKWLESAICSIPPPPPGVRRSGAASRRRKLQFYVSIVGSGDELLRLMENMFSATVHAPSAPPSRNWYHYSFDDTTSLPSLLTS